MSAPASSLLGRVVLRVAFALGAAGALIGIYHHQVVKPMQRIGVVDVSAVYRLKEEQFTKLLTHATTEADKESALALARDFSRQLPKALDTLPSECNCLVLVKGALAGPTPHTVDLTAHLKAKVDAP